MRPLDHQGYRRHLGSGDRRFGLTTVDEQAWCRWFGAEGFANRGAIVELGAWLGSLTASYCDGLRENEKTPEGRPVAHAYDLFRWEEWCENEVSGSVHAGKVPIGSSYEPYFRQLHARHLDLVNVEVADLTRCRWRGGPIELLLNDATKTPDVANNVFREFVPCLVPDVGLMANQDYLWPTDAFLTVPLYLARKSFHFEYTVPMSCMVVFRFGAPLDGPVVLPSRLPDLDRALIDDAFAWSRQTVDAEPLEIIRLGHAVTLWRAEHAEAARCVVEENDLGRKRGDPVYDFQLDALRSWGYGDLLPGG